MEKKGHCRRETLVAIFLLVIMGARFQRYCSAASQPPSKEKSSQRGSSVVFPVTGNVYPLGYYSVIIQIGNPPKPYELDIDTGSDLTWVQCDAPCTGCTKPSHELYKPQDNLVPCSHHLCNALHNRNPEKYHCEEPDEQCDYEIEYADHGSSLGVLVKDEFPLRLTNGSHLSRHLAFGCGYDQRNPGPHAPPPTCGILGLGRGNASIVSQLQTLGVSRNVIGHCLSRAGGGYMFFGDHLLPSSGISWVPMTHNNLHSHYSFGPAELLFGGKVTGIKGLEFVFDSGSSYTYFSDQLYQSTLNQIQAHLNKKPLEDALEDNELAVCWKSQKPIKSIHDIKSYFKPLTLKFKNRKSVQLQITPEDYLIISKHGNVCLGILNGTEQGLENVNVIGDIFLLDKMVIYDNEREQLGWSSANCDRLPNVDHEYNEGFSQPYAADFGILEGHRPGSNVSI